MSRANHKLVKQRLNEKRSKISDRQFFKSRMLAAHFEDIAAAQTRRYKYNRRVRVNIFWKPKDNEIAHTDNLNIDKNTEVYFEPQPYTEVFPTRERSFDEEEIYSQEVVWVEPISTDLKLRDMLRGKYSVKGEYVENTRGNRFHLDSYGSLWLAFKAK